MPIKIKSGSSKRLYVFTLGLTALILAAPSHEANAESLENDSSVKKQSTKDRRAEQSGNTSPSGAGAANVSSNDKEYTAEQSSDPHSHNNLPAVSATDTNPTPAANTAAGRSGVKHGGANTALKGRTTR